MAPASFAAFSIAAQPPRTITSASEIFFPPASDPLNSDWIASNVCNTFASSGGLLTDQSFCGASRMRAPFAPPRLSDARNDEAEAHAVETSCDTDSPEDRIFVFSAAMSCSSTSG